MAPTSKTMQKKLDAALKVGQIKKKLHRTLSIGMKKLREAELKEKSVDEGPDCRYVVARYEPDRAFFKLPDNVDTTIRGMFVKWGVLYASEKDTGNEVKVHPNHTTFEEGATPKWADSVSFVKDKPWKWDEQDANSEDEDFDGGFVAFLR